MRRYEVVAGCRDIRDLRKTAAARAGPFAARSLARLSGACAERFEHRRACGTCEIAIEAIERFATQPRAARRFDVDRVETLEHALLQCGRSVRDARFNDKRQHVLRGIRRRVERRERRNMPSPRVPFPGRRAARDRSADFGRERPPLHELVRAALRFATPRLHAAPSCLFDLDEERFELRRA